MGTSGLNRTLTGADPRLYMPFRAEAAPCMRVRLRLRVGFRVRVRVRVRGSEMCARQQL